MKLAKYVVIGQVALSVILLVVFVTRSGAQARDPAHGKRAAEAHRLPLGAENDREEEPEAEDEEARRPKRKKKGEAEKPAAPGEAHGQEHDKAPAAAASASGKDKGETDAKEPRKETPVVPPAAAPAPTTFATDPKGIAQALLAGNARFADGQRSSYNLVEQRQASAAAQHPNVMVLGCADSRVPPELIFDRGVGELFVVRSAGNIADPVAVGSLEYAAEHLHAKVLVVLGHQKCGAVAAALSDAKLPSPNLETLVANILPGVRELRAWADGEALMQMAVEANVRRQADEVLRRSPILQRAVGKKELTVLKAVYNLQTGHVHPL